MAQVMPNDAARSHYAPRNGTNRLTIRPAGR